MLNDAKAGMGCWHLADEERLIIEPACGVSVAMCYDGRLKELLPHLSRESKVVVIVCGGLDIMLQTLCQFKEKYSEEEKMAMEVVWFGRPPSPPNRPENSQTFRVIIS